MYPYIKDKYNFPKGVGTVTWNDTKQWCETLLEPIKHRSEQIVLDYGCGDGRLANFMAAKFKNWKYYGIDHPDSALQSLAKVSPFFQDERCVYGLVGSDIEKEALENAKTVVLGSVITHLRKEDFYKLMRKFKPIGEIVFSVFLADEYSYSGPGAYGISNCYGLVYYTRQQLESWAKRNKAVLTEHGQFLAQKQHLHKIFKVEV